MDSRRALTVVVAAVAMLAAALPATAGAKHEHPRPPAVQELVSFAAAGCMERCGSGSTVGPDGALYVTDGPTGRVLRVDPWSGAITTFASGLPLRAVPDVGGAMDVAFLGRTAYVIVTVVGPGVGQPDVVDGLYRVNRDGSVEPVADIGQWSMDNPPETDFFVPGGLQYSLEPYFGGFLVADGHHNRVLFVTPHGDIHEVIAFGNIVPTGLETIGKHILLGQAGPVPHLPETGKVVHFTPWSDATDVATGAPLIVDVELGPRWRLYALSQGIWVPPAPEGSPASPDTGQLVRVNRHGGFDTVVAGLDRPTSVDFIGDTAYVVTLTGKVLKIDLGRSHRGKPH